MNLFRKKKSCAKFILSIKARRIMGSELGVGEVKALGRTWRRNEDDTRLH